ncbi:MAG: glycosyltransferase family 2 protein [Clostridiales bacterium]|nr:glycosyltransferase family 2 protein [Clostridiales bacterium]
MPPIAVIILNWNGEKLLPEFLPSVVANTPGELADVIVADNGSTDGSLEILQRDFPRVKVLDLGTNYGFAEGYNRAIALTRYSYTLLLNSDVMTPAGWLEPLYRWAMEHPDMGAAMPKVRSYRQRDMFEYAGACGGFLDRNGYPYCRGRIFDTVEKDNGQYDTPMQVFWATGAAMLVNTEAFLRAGGLDSSFFAHMEEIDLCWRLKLAGYTNWVVPQAVVYHLGGASLDASNPRKTYLNFRNNLLMMHKNLPRNVRRGMLFRRRLLDTLAWARFVAVGKWKHAVAIVRAHRDYSRMAPRYDTHPDRNLIAHAPNILIGYYLKGHHTYRW